MTAGTTTTATPQADAYSNNQLRIENVSTEYPDDQELIGSHEVDGNNGWYPGLQGWVESVARECVRQSGLHSDTSRAYGFRNNLVLSSLQILPFAQGVSILIPMPTYLSNFIQGFCALLLVLIASLNRLMHFSEKETEHRAISHKYMQLNSSITIRILVPMERRPNGVHFANWCRKTFFSILTLAPYYSVKRKRKQTVDAQVELPELPEAVNGTAIATDPGVDVPNLESDALPKTQVEEEHVRKAAAYRQYMSAGINKFKFRAEYDSPEHQV